MRRVLLLVSVAALLAGCVTTKAKTPTERPNLDVPPPPPRVIEVTPPTEAPPPEPVGDLPASPTNPRPRPQRSAEPAKQEPPKTEPPPVEQPPVTPPATTAPPQQLRTTNTPDAAQAERQVRDVINRANGLLNSIDGRTLSTERRAQYDNAKLMLKQAEEGIKAANFDLAKNLAEKAERIAKELQGR